MLEGVLLDGAAARLAAMLDRALLDEAGWDPATRILHLPAGHRLLGRQVCRAGGCAGTAATTAQASAAAASPGWRSWR